MKTSWMVLSVACVSFVTLKAAAEDKVATSCKQGKVERTVSLVFPEAGKKAPCEVHYIKGEDDKVIFSAKNEVGFCEKKAEDFIAKLKTSGFNCDGDKVAAAEPAAAPAAVKK